MDWLKNAIGCVGIAAGCIWGDLDGLLIGLLLFIGCDYVTGIIKACIQKRLSSEIGFKGLLKKIAIMVVVGIANILDVYVLKNGPIFKSGACFFYIANEGISLMENMATIGLPFPKKLKEKLLQLKEDEGSGTSDSNEGN